MVARKKPVAAAVNTSTAEREAIHSAMDELLDNKPSHARLVIAFVASFCSGVAFGWLASTAIEFLTISALVFTGSVHHAHAQRWAVDLGAWSRSGLGQDQVVLR